jgi:hypothetical protein
MEEVVEVTLEGLAGVASGGTSVGGDEKMVGRGRGGGVDFAQMPLLLQAQLVQHVLVVAALEVGYRLGVAPVQVEFESKS